MIALVMYIYYTTFTMIKIRTELPVMCRVVNGVNLFTIWAFHYEYIQNK